MQAVVFFLLRWTQLHSICMCTKARFTWWSVPQLFQMTQNHPNFVRWDEIVSSAFKLLNSTRHLSFYLQSHWSRWNVLAMGSLAVSTYWDIEGKQTMFVLIMCLTLGWNTKRLTVEEAFQILSDIQAEFSILLSKIVNFKSRPWHPW
jgi:hypothetical protein